MLGRRYSKKTDAAPDRKLRSGTLIFRYNLVNKALHYLVSHIELFLLKNLRLHFVFCFLTRMQKKSLFCEAKIVN